MVFLFAQTPNVFAELCDDDGPGGANFHCISKKYVEGGSGNRITIQTPDLFIEEEQCLTEIANVNQWIVFDNGRFVEIGITAGTITDKDVGVTECLESETIYHTYKSATYQEHKIETVPVGSIQSFEISNINGDLLWDVYWLNNDEKNPIITRLMPDSVAQNQDVGYETSVASSEYTSIPETHFSGVQTYDGSSWASWNDKIVQNTKSGGDSGTTLISCNDSKDHFHGGNFLFSECTETISLWIKESTAAWTQGHHGDAEYVANIGFLIDNGIIPVNAQTTANNPEIPPFVKDVADWWSQGLVTDTEYINALTYLVENGIIILQGEDEESTTSALLSLAQNFDTYTTGDVTITPISDPSRGCQPNCYSPSVVTVDSGSTITFSNTDDSIHSFTSGTPYTGPDGSWNSGIVFGGGEYSVTLHNPGTYQYYSLFDSWMQGTIIVNDPISPPTSNGATISALRNIPASITLSASSESAETLDFIITQNPTSGTLDHTTIVPNDTPTSATVTYTSQSSFSGTDSFSFQSRDESGELSIEATITINVTIPDTERPTANQQTISTQENQPITITLTGYSPNDNSLDFIILDGTPAHGDISVVTTINDNSARLVYTPGADYYVDDTISFRVTDGFKTSGDADISISIIQHVNSAPISSPDNVNIPEDVTSYSINVLSNDYDADAEFYGDEIFVHSVDTRNTSGGTATISSDSKSISFTPNQNFDGMTTFSYIAKDSDGVQSSSATVTIYMVPSFDSPISAPDTTTVGVDSEGNNISVLSNDSDPDTGDVLSVLSLDSTATRGTAQISSDSLSILFTPESGFAGTTIISYVTEDLAGNTADSTTITVEVSPSEGKAMYVASGGSGEVIAYNPDGSLLSEHITDGLSSPWGVAVSPDGNYIYVSSYTTNKILKYDRATGGLIDSFTNNAESASSSVTVFAQSKQGESIIASLQPQNEILTANNDISYNTLNQDVSSVLVYDDTTGDYIGEFTREQLLPDGLSTDEYTNSVTVTDDTGITHEFVNAAFSELSSPRSITFGPDGNLYISSASNNKIVKFDITTNQYTDFAESGFFSSPIGLSWGDDGSLYVASSGNDQILSFDSNGNYDSQFVIGTNRPQAITWGPDGNLYVVSLGGNTVLVYDGTANLLRTIGAFSDGLDIPHGITFGPDGNLYVSSFSFSNKILQYDTSGNLINDAFVGSSNNGGLFDPFDLTFADEPVYNTTPIAINDVIEQQVIQEISFEINTATLLNNDSDADDDDIITVLSVDGTSTNGGTITLFDNTIIYTSPDSFVGDDTFSYTITDGTDTDSAVVTVTVIEQSTSNETFVYVIDNYSKELTKFNGIGNYISTITGFIGPFDVDSDNIGNIYASATNWHRIEKYDSNDDLVLTIQGIGTTESLNDLSSLYAPHGTAVDNTTGDIYSVTWAGFVQKFDSEGDYITHWGEKGSNDGQFKNPNGIATDSEGNVYVADRLNHRIQKFDSTGNHLLTFGEKGQQDGQFSWPSKISIDGNNNVYVADSDNDRIQKFDNIGNHLLTITMPDNDIMDWVADVDTDEDGNIYAIDQRHYRIIKWDSAGTFVDSWAYGSFDKMIGIAVVG
jgi:DNA-binding beta-propeller fold protein YncE/plastocyanin